MRPPRVVIYRIRPSLSIARNRASTPTRHTLNFPHKAEKPVGRITVWKIRIRWHSTECRSVQFPRH